MLKRSLGLVLAAATLGMTALPAAADGIQLPAVPIPGDVRGTGLEPFLGQPATPHPIAAPDIPQNPFMAPNGSSNLHDDAYQTDAYRGSGPDGKDLAVSSRLQGGLCGSITFDSQGRLVSVCMAPGLSPKLVLLNPHTLATIDTMTLPGKASASFTDVSGGGYFYLDNHNRAVIPTKDGGISVVAIEGDKLVKQLHYDLSAVAGSSGILSALPDWSGRLWFVTGNGVVGTLDMATGAVATHTLGGERIANSLAVDESGGVFIVSDHALYRFDAGPGGEVQVTWRMEYDRGTGQKPGQLSQGSGTTPTLIGSASGPEGGYVAITDNADPKMNVVVVARGKAGPTEVCKQPIFAAGEGADENSLVAVGGDLIAENNYGYKLDEHPLLKGILGGRQPDTTPGVVRVHVDYAHRACSVAWTNTTERVPSVVSKAALGNGLFYTYTHPTASELDYKPGGGLLGAPDAWYLTALDLCTGKRVWSKLAGTGPLYNNHYAPIVIGKDKTAYTGAVGGMVRIADSDD
ncbi:hypothetical protein GCM10010448_44360 [Streptomyces glomeratus]|uniref:PQQ-binding-like beta-propeller repeat protein n=2 Tax=Streptomyces glomeratus TaxID=284452 RepID=A0ABP6LR64_9ACTN